MYIGNRFYRKSNCLFNTKYPKNYVHGLYLICDQVQGDFTISFWVASSNLEQSYDYKCQWNYPENIG